MMNAEWIVRGRRIVAGAVLAGGLLLGGTAGAATTWRIEAEAAGPGHVDRELPGEYIPMFWNPEKFAGASDGTILGGLPYGVSHSIPTTIPHAGKYRVWVRHLHTPGKFTSFFTLFRNDMGESLGSVNLDFKSRFMSATPPKPEAEPVKDAKEALVWSSFEMIFERPTQADISFGPSGGLVDGKVGIDCVIVSDDLAFDPRESDLAKLPTAPGPMEPSPTPPRGMKSAPVFTDNSSFFAGVADSKTQFQFAFCGVGGGYENYAWQVQLGSNHDHGWQSGSVKYGVSAEATPECGQIFTKPFNELAAKVPAPTGRVVSPGGAIGGFSLSYEPYLKTNIEAMRRALPNFSAIPETCSYLIIGEDGGHFDYGDAARDGFHRFLAERFGDISKLNEAWRTHYAGFDDVVLPHTPKESENKAPWFAFREFCGLETCKFVGDKAKFIRENDPRHLPSASQTSCLSINSPGFTAIGPIDFEDLINVGFADEPEFGMDSYSAQDYFCGCDMEFLVSLVGNRRLFNNEFNVHSQDPRDMARSYWCQIGKGLKGISTWCFQSAHNDWVYYMWGLLDTDNRPRNKLGPIADANHEVHHLERILAPARRENFVKPVALYYSRMDLSLPQPTFGIYSSSFDNPYRIYTVLRGLGYQVRWITPRQIEAGQLKDCGAVMMVGVKYVPGKAAQVLAQWVKDGGSLIGDQWPGALDEYDRPQVTLLDVFGIRPLEIPKPVDKSKAKEEFAAAATPVGGGIDPEVLRAMNADELFKNVEEMWDQWDATCPVAKAVGNWHLSGFDMKKIKVISGEIVGMGMGGGAAGIPAMVINDYGKGHAFYFASMIGSLYEAGPMAAEWDSAKEGAGFPHLIDAYLKFSGVQPFAQTGLPERTSWQLRIELPLVDAKGNVFVGMTSQAEGRLSPFPLTLRWPDSAPTPKLLLVCVSGSRRLQQVPFTIKNGEMSLTMPGFDTHASLVALTDSDPLISLEFTGAPRTVAGLLDVKPGARLKLKATVWNPSSRALDTGKINLFAGPGWNCDQGEAKVRSIKAYGSREVNFEVAPPALCAGRTLKPIVLKYESDQVTSTPATEIVWWEPESK